MGPPTGQDELEGFAAVKQCVGLGRVASTIRTGQLDRQRDSTNVRNPPLSVELYRNQ
jgi:hypothetical protein